MPKLHVHIGHHFFGAGNLGDDLMLAGFLEAARPAFLDRVNLTCCALSDLASQRLRFPEIEWLPYDDATRADCIGRCDAWLGLGDTPFQATAGHTWFLDHLVQEAAWCRPADVPMYYLGIGVNEREVTNFPQTRSLLEQAERLWMRDEDSAAWLAPLARSGSISDHADLAHLSVETMTFPPPAPGSLGLVLNFEDPAQFRPEWIAGLVRASGASDLRWLVQEVRPLPGSETFLYDRLPSGERPPLCAPDYAGAGSARALLVGWEGLDALFSSRYHGALIGAWAGARVAIFPRNDKVVGAARQLGLAVAPDMSDTAGILAALRETQPIERARLLALAGQVRVACEEFFAAVAG